MTFQKTIRESWRHDAKRRIQMLAMLQMRPQKKRLFFEFKIFTMEFVSQFLGNVRKVENCYVFCPSIAPIQWRILENGKIGNVNFAISIQ